MARSESALACGLPVEVFFLRYAFPCAFVLRQRGEVDDAVVARLEAAAVAGRVLPRVFLEKVFRKAFGRMARVAGEMRLPVWDERVVKAYFRERHNEFIEEGDGYYATAPEDILKLCRVEEAVVEGVRDGVLLVRYGGGKERAVSSAFVPGVKPGDRVAIHYGYAVEKLV